MMQGEAKTYTVLLLSAPIGSGHKLAAEALEQELRLQPHVKVVQGNIFDFFPKFLGIGFLRSYLWILAHCPWLYALAYKWGNRQGGSLWLRSLLNGALSWLGRGYLARVAPDAVVATHATPAGIMGYYKKKHPHLWLGAVITDFTIHRWWLCPGVDTYFIADELLRSKIIMPADVQPTGIPVRRQFLQHDREECRKKLGWADDKKVCLLMGGGEGLLPMEEIISALRKADLPNLRLVAVTGRNEKLRLALQQKFAAAAEIYGFREDVPQMMAGADMIITKAGGLTAAEVLASGLQLFIYKPLPGQEAGNAAFLHRHGGAQVAHKLPELVKYVQQACYSNEQRAISPLGHPDAAQKICTYILNRLKKY